MLIKAKDLKNYRLDSLSGEIGRVQEFYFDDKHWVVRYLVADTGDWMPGRMVLLSPYALGAVSKEGHNIAVALTKAQIEASPALESAKPVSRQFEELYHRFHGWPGYWSGPYLWGKYPELERDPKRWDDPDLSDVNHDYHLRSTRDVGSHHVHASDGDIGSIEDFVIDDRNWAIRYLVIDTGHWLPGKKVLISPRWIERISWMESKVHVGLTREAIRSSPEYSDALLASRDYEAKLHRHYDRWAYWSD